jgi:antitoxin VapB
MAINIKNFEVEDSIRKLANQLGVDLTEAVKRAVDHELNRGPAAKQAKLAKMRAVSNRVAQQPEKDPRSEDEILGYNEAGLWT